jgi:hypothetical protein
LGRWGDLFWFQLIPRIQFEEKEINDTDLTNGTNENFGKIVYRKEGMEIKRNPAYQFYKTTVEKTEWKLLLFLLLLLNVKLIVKFIAIVLIYAIEKNFRFGFRFRSSRLPLFYLFAISIAFLDLLFYRLFTDINYDVVFLTGICFWVMSILAMHQMKLFTEKIGPEKILHTLTVFFAINAFF